MKTILLVSDTHVPDRAPDIPIEFIEYSQKLFPDYVIHLGDFTEHYVVGLFYEKLPGNFIGVAGNMDTLSIENELGKIKTLKIYNWKILITHGDIVPRGSLPALKAVAEKFSCNVVFFGHTHKPLVEIYEGTLFVNPGSLLNGSIRFQKDCFAVINIDENCMKITHIETHSFNKLSEKIISIENIEK